MVIPQKTHACDGREPLVLVVDDESGVRRIAVSVLKRVSCTTLEAGDGEEALQIYQGCGQTVDLVLLDLSMPKLSGRETFIALKGMDPDLPILLCSGYPIDTKEFEAETGFCPVGVIQKPFDVSGLISSVTEALNSSVTQPATT